MPAGKVKETSINMTLVKGRLHMPKREGEVSPADCKSCRSYKFGAGKSPARSPEFTSLEKVRKLESQVNSPA